MVPEKPFRNKLIVSMLVRVPITVGIVPDKLLLSTESARRFLLLTIVDGIVPVNWFSSKIRNSV